MRPVPLLLALALIGLAGCLTDSPGPEEPEPRQERIAAEVPEALRAEDGSVRLVELYDGIIVGANAEVLVVSPDQLGRVDRQFYVHTGTRNLTLHLEASDELRMSVLDPDCHDLDCGVQVETQGGSVTHVIEAPKVGGWEVVFFKRDPGAAEVDYALQVTKSQDYLHAVEGEIRTGGVVAAHLGAIRISPDQNSR